MTEYKESNESCTKNTNTTNSHKEQEEINIFSTPPIKYKKQKICSDTNSINKIKKYESLSLFENNDFDTYSETREMREQLVEQRSPITRKKCTNTTTKMLSSYGTIWPLKNYVIKNKNTKFFGVYHYGEILSNEEQKRVPILYRKYFYLYYIEGILQQCLWYSITNTTDCITKEAQKDWLNRSVDDIIWKNSSNLLYRKIDKMYQKYFINTFNEDEWIKQIVNTSIICNEIGSSTSIRLGRRWVDHYDYCHDPCSWGYSNDIIWLFQFWSNKQMLSLSNSSIDKNIQLKKYCETNIIFKDELQTNDIQCPLRDLNIIQGPEFSPQELQVRIIFIVFIDINTTYIHLTYTIAPHNSTKKTRSMENNKIWITT